MPEFSLSFNDDEEVELNIDLLPSLEQEDDLFSAPIPEKPTETNRIVKVDLAEKKEASAEQTTFAAETGTEEAEEEKTIEEMLEEEPLTDVDDIPQFPGGLSEMVKWITDRLHYPTTARNDNVKGRVLVQFVVNTDGSLADMKVVEHADSRLDNEALRVLKLMPKWKPGRDKGKKCRTLVSIPIVFAM